MFKYYAVPTLFIHSCFITAFRNMDAEHDLGSHGHDSMKRKKKKKKKHENELKHDDEDALSEMDEEHDLSSHDSVKKKKKKKRRHEEEFEPEDEDEVPYKKKKKKKKGSRNDDKDGSVVKEELYTDTIDFKYRYTVPGKKEERDGMLMVEMSPTWTIPDLIKCLRTRYLSDINELKFNYDIVLYIENSTGEKCYRVVAESWKNTLAKVFKEKFHFVAVLSPVKYQILPKEKRDRPKSGPTDLYILKEELERALRNDYIQPVRPLSLHQALQEMEKGMDTLFAF